MGELLRSLLVLFGAVVLTAGVALQWHDAMRAAREEAQFDDDLAGGAFGGTLYSLWVLTTWSFGRGVVRGRPSPGQRLMRTAQGWWLIYLAAGTSVVVAAYDYMAAMYAWATSP